MSQTHDPNPPTFSREKTDSAFMGLKYYDQLPLPQEIASDLQDGLVLVFATVGNARLAAQEEVYQNPSYAQFFEDDKVTLPKQRFKSAGMQKVVCLNKNFSLKKTLDNVSWLLETLDEKNYLSPIFTDPGKKPSPSKLGISERSQVRFSDIPKVQSLKLDMKDRSRAQAMRNFLLRYESSIQDDLMMSLPALKLQDGSTLQREDFSSDSIQKLSAILCSKSVNDTEVSDQGTHIDHRAQAKQVAYQTLGNLSHGPAQIGIIPYSALILREIRSFADRHEAQFLKEVMEARSYFFPAKSLLEQMPCKDGDESSMNEKIACVWDCIVQRHINKNFPGIPPLVEGVANLDSLDFFLCDSDFAHFGRKFPSSPISVASPARKMPRRRKEVPPAGAGAAATAALARQISYNFRMHIYFAAAFKRSMDPQSKYQMQHTNVEQFTVDLRTDMFLAPFLRRMAWPEHV
jgi:hypothetical protein